MISGLSRGTRVHPVAVVPVQTIAIAHAHRIGQRQRCEPNLQMRCSGRQSQWLRGIERTRVGRNRFDLDGRSAERLADVARVDDRHAAARNEPQAAVGRAHSTAAPLAEGHASDAIRGVEQPEPNLIRRVSGDLVDFARIQAENAAAVPNPDEAELVLDDGLHVSGKAVLTRDFGEAAACESAQALLSACPDGAMRILEHAADDADARFISTHLAFGRSKHELATR